MSDTVIRVENLGKKYTLGRQKQERYTALQDVISNSAKSAGRKFLKPFGKKMSDPAIEDFWALKDVSFEIKQGDRVGIIGRNGAGKSTLLKILSRITEPSKGRISIQGRIASLLEVGTGFHPELTGRENIYLNGAILGMSKAEIKRKFDEIVTFAEVEKFLDTPVKRYSSGMYVRLAFAVAAHLEPEILIVDEVLAVGDAQFQKKCLGKMGEVASQGRTVLFVSHNMGAVNALCDRAVYLVKGKVMAVGDANEIVTDYLKEGFNNKAEDLNQLRLPGCGRDIRFYDIQLSSENGANLLFNQPINFVLKIQSNVDAKDLFLGTSIFDSSGNCVGTHLSSQTFSPKAGHRIIVHQTLYNLHLAPGSYYAGFGIASGVKESHVHNLDGVIGIPAFQILPTSCNGDQIGNWHSNWGRIVIQDVDLTIEDE
jgi:lipopolysaccharide transport system ATP-binding protein